MRKSSSVWRACQAVDLFDGANNHGLSNRGVDFSCGYWPSFPPHLLGREMTKVAAAAACMEPNKSRDAAYDSCRADPLTYAVGPPHGESRTPMACCSLFRVIAVAPAISNFCWLCSHASLASTRGEWVISRRRS